MQTFDILLLIILIAFIFGLSYYTKDPSKCLADPMLEQLKIDIRRIEPKSENLQFYVDKESYTLDKSKVFLCLKDSDGKYYPYETLIAVCCHELAHAMSPVIDPEHQSKEFNSLHKYYRQRAIELGLLPAHYHPSPGYCPQDK